LFFQALCTARARASEVKQRLVEEIVAQRGSELFIKASWYQFARRDVVPLDPHVLAPEQHGKPVNHLLGKCLRI
jgi:hypothetical protein